MVPEHRNVRFLQWYRPREGKEKRRKWIGVSEHGERVVR